MLLSIFDQISCFDRCLAMLLSIFDIFDILTDETDRQTDNRQTDRQTIGDIGPAQAGQLYI